VLYSLLSFAVNPSVFSNITLLYPLVGTSVTIWVQVSGNPVPQPGDIKWYRNDVLINDEDSSLTLSQDHTTLIINNIMGDYYGIYRCRVSTSAGTRYHNVTITQPRKFRVVVLESYVTSRKGPRYCPIELHVM